MKRSTLSESDWHTILETIGPLPRGARRGRARRELARCLRAYPGLRRDPAELRARRAWEQRKRKLAIELYAMLTEDRRKGQTRNDLVDDAFKRYLLPSTKAAADFRAAQVRMHKGKRDYVRDWLYLSLLHIWKFYLCGELRASRGSGGPCVRFVRTAMAFVLPANEVPSVETVRRIVHQLARREPLGNYVFDSVMPPTASPP